MTLNEIRNAFRKCADRKKAYLLQRFFKTGTGEYAEGDRFLGIVVPVIRSFVKKCEALPLKKVVLLLGSRFHEERLLALLVLVWRFGKGNEAEKGRIYRLYLKNSAQINNWDLVDLTAPNIAGAYLFGRNRKPLFRLAKSKCLWKRRIAILSTFYFIRRNQFTDTFKIAAMLLRDKEDLIHKAAGWMLREAGKRALRKEERFLRKHYSRMPRTMLRYAIEKFPEIKRRKFLKGLVR